MNRLIDPPGIRMAVQRMVCTACGEEANATCTCGVPYVPKAVERVAEYDKANPGRSQRQAAADLGIPKSTINDARQAVARTRAPESDAASPVTISGRDGKNYPATKPHTDAGAAPHLVTQAHRHLGKIVELLRQMDERERLSFRQTALQQMADAYLDDDVLEF